MIINQTKEANWSYIIVVDKANNKDNYFQEVIKIDEHYKTFDVLKSEV